MSQVRWPLGLDALAGLKHRPFMTIAPRPIRSALYLPASNAKALAKARTLSADILILDLEDSVAPDMKIEARAAAVAALREGGLSARTIAIRINGRETPWGIDDLAAVAHSGVDAILVPKISHVQDIEVYDRALASSPTQTTLWAMIETCASLFQLNAIAACAANTRLSLFIMGINDLAKEMRAKLTPDRTPFLPFLTQSVAAARANGVAILDGVCNEFRDLDVFRAEATQGLLFGFDGKTLIHPNQIETCNSIFSPSEEEIAWAHSIVSAFALPENAQKGVIQVNGKMVELLHLQQAQNLLTVSELY